MENKAVVDANFLIALGNPLDPHAESSEHIFKELVKQDYFFVTNNYLVAEAFTVILLRTKKLEQVQFFKEKFLEVPHRKISTYQATSYFDRKVYEIFITQKKYKSGFLSFADCSLVVQSRKLGIQTLLTFDETFKQFASEFTIMGV